MLPRNLPTKLLKKDERGSINVNHLDFVKVMSKIDIDSRPAVQAEETTICPNGRGIILITLKKDVRIEQFCRHEVLEVIISGIRAVNVRPSESN